MMTLIFRKLLNFHKFKYKIIQKIDRLIKFKVVNL